MVDICGYKFVQNHSMSTLRVNPNEKYGLWVIKMCQSRFISWMKCTILAGALVMEETMHIWGQRAWEISVPSSNFSCEPKITLKNKVLKKENLSQKIFMYH